MLVAAPVHHSFGFDVGLLAPLFAGATLYLEDEVSVKRLTKLLRDERIDLFPASPALFGALSREVAVKPLTAKNARFLSSGVVPAAPAWPTLSTNATGCGCCPATTPPRPARSASSARARSPRTVGKPYAGVELRLGGGDAPAAAR